MQQSNNLLRESGQDPIFCGRKIVIKGKLLDQNCVPISDAKIYLWQVGSDGKYSYTPLRGRISKNMLNLCGNTTFTGSGIATTNNKGEFYFITVYTPNSQSALKRLDYRMKWEDDFRNYLKALEERLLVHAKDRWIMGNVNVEGFMNGQIRQYNDRDGLLKQVL